MANSTQGLAEDMSLYSADYSLLGEFSHPVPVEIVISTVVWSMCFLAVAGNIVVIVAILGDKQLRSNVANVYILNLASADLCVGLNSLIFNNIWRYYGNWPFRRAVCTFWIILDYSACMQAALAVSLISLDRYFMVTKFLKYQKYQSTRLALRLIAATWTVSLLFNGLPILGSDLWPESKDYVVNYSVTCDFGVLYIVSYNIAQIVVGFVVPAIILAYLNVMVYYNILQRSRGLVRTAPAPPSMPSCSDRPTNSQAQHSFSNANASIVTTNHGPASHDTRRTYKRHRKAAITLAVIVGTFALCWIPYYVMQLLSVLQEIEFRWLHWNSVYYNVWVNSAINPFLYAAMNPRIKQRVLLILCFWNCRIFKRNKNRRI